MKNLTIPLREKRGVKQVESLAIQKGWQPEISNPDRRKHGEAPTIPNPTPASDFLIKQFQNELDAAFINVESREAAQAAQDAKQAELRKEFNQ